MSLLKPVNTRGEENTGKPSATVIMRGKEGINAALRNSSGEMSMLNMTNERNGCLFKLMLNLRRSTEHWIRKGYEEVSQDWIATPTLLIDAQVSILSTLTPSSNQHQSVSMATGSSQDTSNPIRGRDDAFQHKPLM